MGKVISRAVMGADPGTAGALTVLNEDGAPTFIGPFRPGMTEDEMVHVAELAAIALRREQGSVCYFEKVGFIRGDGGQGAFTFGLVNGLVRGALRVQRVEIRLVPPLLWQARMQCLTGGNKNISRLRAEALYPAAFPKGMHKYQADNIADSLLIARYGWIMEAL